MGSFTKLPPPVTPAALKQIKIASRDRLSGNVIQHYETVLTPVSRLVAKSGKAAKQKGGGSFSKKKK